MPLFGGKKSRARSQSPKGRAPSPKGRAPSPKGTKQRETQNATREMGDYTAMLGDADKAEAAGDVPLAQALLEQATEAMLHAIKHEHDPVAKGLLREQATQALDKAEALGRRKGSHAGETPRGSQAALLDSSAAPPLFPSATPSLQPPFARQHSEKLWQIEAIRAAHIGDGKSDAELRLRLAKHGDNVDAVIDEILEEMIAAEMPDDLPDRSFFGSLPSLPCLCLCVPRLVSGLIACTRLRPARRSPLDMWVCSACTLENRIDEMVCAACDRTRSAHVEMGAALARRGMTSAESLARRVVVPAHSYPPESVEEFVSGGLSGAPTFSRPRRCACASVCTREHARMPTACMRAGDARRALPAHILPAHIRSTICACPICPHPFGPLPARRRRPAAAAAAATDGGSAPKGTPPAGGAAEIAPRLAGQRRASWRRGVGARPAAETQAGVDGRAAGTGHVVTACTSASDHSASSGQLAGGGGDAAACGGAQAGSRA